MIPYFPILPIPIYGFMKNNNIYLLWSSILGHKAKIYIILAQRGIGKTFGIKRKVIQDFIESRGQKRFIYVCNTITQCKILAQNRGEKFFSKLIEYYRLNTSKRHERYLNVLTNANTSLEESADGRAVGQMIGSTIKIGGLTAGYLVALSDFSNIKRNDFVNVSSVIVDEFVSEKFDITTLKLPYQLVSVIQSIVRTEDVTIYMLGNSVRRSDPILSAFKLNDIKKGEKRRIYDETGLLIYAESIDPAKYASYNDTYEKSVAGRLGKYLGKDNLEKNDFADDLDASIMLPETLSNSHLLLCLHGVDNISVRINITQSNNQLYILEDQGSNTQRRYCVDKKAVAPGVPYSEQWRNYLIYMYSNNKCRFENSRVYVWFKELLNIS